MKKYRTLSLIIGLGKFLAALIIIATIIFALLALQKSNLPAIGGLVIGGVVSAFFIMVNIQLLEVFVDIAKNTAETTNLLKNK